MAPEYKNLKGGNCKEISIKLHYPEFYEYLNQNYPGELTFSEKLYWYFNGLTERPQCQHPECTNKTTFINVQEGYRDYCSRKCLNSDPLKKERAKNTCFERFGGPAPACSKSIIHKTEKTNLERYGTKNVMQNKELAEKSHNTNIRLYGGCGNASEMLLEKYKQTNSSIYGVDNYMQSQSFYDKILEHHPDIISFDIKSRTAICSCPDASCDLCQERQFEIDFSEYQSRLTNNIPLCTKQYHLQPHNIRGTYIETFIRNILDTHNVEYECNNRSILSGKEIDIYVPSKKIGIECNGIYWHSTSSPNKKPLSYHFNKWKECKENGIQLLTIWEDQIINKPDIVESIILSKLGIYERRIYARNCQVKEVDSKECYSFLKAYHLQGASNSKVRYGLYYNGELISVMTFGLKRRCMGGKGEWELHRYCNKKGVQVVGGASRLFKHFLNAQKPIFIESFSSNDISDGRLYETLKFDMLKCEYGSYWYIDKNMNRHHRYNFRKDQLVKEGFDASKSEFTIMEERGYYRIYDSGQTKWALDLHMQNN